MTRSDYDFQLLSLLGFPRSPGFALSVQCRLDLVLTEVTMELARYHPVRFVFADAELRDTTLRGAFDSGDLDPFLRALERVLSVHVQRFRDGESCCGATRSRP